jgi:hypothetical protein
MPSQQSANLCHRRARSGLYLLVLIAFSSPVALGAPMDASTPAAVAPARPAPALTAGAGAAQRARQLQQVSAELHGLSKGVLAFWLDHGLDRQYGGFHGVRATLARARTRTRARARTHGRGRREALARCSREARVLAGSKERSLLLGRMSTAKHALCCPPPGPPDDRARRRRRQADDQGPGPAGAPLLGVLKRGRGRRAARGRPPEGRGGGAVGLEVYGRPHAARRRHVVRVRARADMVTPNTHAYARAERGASNRGGAGLRQGPAAHRRVGGARLAPGPDPAARHPAARACRAPARRPPGRGP